MLRSYRSRICLVAHMQIKMRCDYLERIGMRLFSHFNFEIKYTSRSDEGVTFETYIYKNFRSEESNE